MLAKDMEKWAAYVYEVPRKAFFMGKWASCSVKDLRKAQKNDWKCGMVACLGGFATVLFPRKLKLLSYGAGAQVVAYKDSCLRGKSAIAKAFDICYDHAQFLTSVTADHNTPKRAAAAIRKLIKQNPECCR